MSPKLPEWFKQKPPKAGELKHVERLISSLELHTVCQGAHCPNMWQCFASGTATFMILGNICSRNCTFCAVDKGTPLPVDADEPQNIAHAVKALGLNYVVITCVTRDDLSDGGATHFVETIKELRKSSPNLKIEVLVSDFNGNQKAIEIVARASPQVFAHNLETVPGLYQFVRPMANYQRSLDVLAQAKNINPRMVTKSGIMLGLGESQPEVLEVMQDLRKVGCELLSIGQYLAPSELHHQIAEFITPKQFYELERIGLNIGFKAVASAPLVRSSYKAGELFEQAFPADVNLNLTF
ncbi:MAG: lipoyl synthase [Dehalococcoidia bacterium]|nr:lipoyl synthase [Dehalococcoidia bacterium]